MVPPFPIGGFTIVFLLGGEVFRGTGGGGDSFCAVFFCFSIADHAWRMKDHERR